MSGDEPKIGPALARLRQRARLSGAEVARRLGKSRPNVSRIEQPDSNPQASKLLRYLEAIEATLTDLDRELAGDRPGSRGEPLTLESLAERVGVLEGMMKGE